MGSPTLDVWVVRKDFAEKHPDVVTAFAASALRAQRPHLTAPEQWLKDRAILAPWRALERRTEAQVPELVKGNRYLPVADQVAQLGQPVDKAIRDTAEFLKQQARSRRSTATSATSPTVL